MSQMPANFTRLPPSGPAFINHDDPTNQTSQPLGGLVYGGSEESTADELLLSAADTPPVAGTAYTWAVSGPGSSLYPLPPSTVAVWNVTSAGVYSAGAAAGTAILNET